MLLIFAHSEENSVSHTVSIFFFAEHKVILSNNLYMTYPL